MSGELQRHAFELTREELEELRTRGKLTKTKGNVEVTITVSVKF